MFHGKVKMARHSADHQQHLGTLRTIIQRASNVYRPWKMAWEPVRGIGLSRVQGTDMIGVLLGCKGEFPGNHQDSCT